MSCIQAVVHLLVKTVITKNLLPILENVEKSFSVFHFRSTSQCRWRPEK